MITSRRTFLAGAAATTAGLAGCASPRSSTNLSVLVNHTNQEAALFQDQIDGFAATRPGVQIRVQNISGAQFYTKLRTVSVTRDLPDVWYARTLDTAFNVANGWQLPLDDRLAADRDRVAVDDFWPAQLRQMSIEGRLYSLPYDFSCYAIYVNTTMFDELGLPRPDDESWTWTDLFDLASAFKRVEGGRQDRWGIYFSLGSWLFDGVFRSNGGALFGDDGRTVEVGSAENIETIRQFYAQLDNGNAAQPQTLGAAVDPFVSGLVAMAINGSWATKQTRDQIGDRFEWDVLKLPRGSTGRREIAAAGGAWGISTDSANPDLAWELITYLSDRDRLNTFVSEPLRGIPGRISAAADEAALAAESRQPPTNFHILSEQFLTDAYEISWPAFWSEYETIWNNRSTALNSGAEPADILPQIQQDAQAAATRFAVAAGGR